MRRKSYRKSVRKQRKRGSSRKRGGSSCGSHNLIPKNGGFIRGRSVQRFLKSRGSLSKN